MLSNIRHFFYLFYKWGVAGRMSPRTGQVMDQFNCGFMGGWEYFKIFNDYDI